MKEAQLRADKALLEAEKFKARVEPPGNDFDQNMSIRDDMQILNIGAGVSDDDFFHLTCHIDPNLIHKIEKGEFVELEKLLPKDKLGRSGEENRLEWVQRDELMLQYTVEPTHIGLRRSGNTSQLLIQQLLHTYGKMCTTTTSLSDISWHLMSQGLLGLCCLIETRDRIERITLTAVLFE